MTRQEKEQVVNDLGEKFERSVSVVVTDYQGLSVPQITELRRRIREAGGEFQVAKNTLTKLAIEDRDLAALSDVLVGPTGLLFTYDDPVATAKLLMDFAKKHEKPEVKGFVLEGKNMGKDKVKDLVSLPSREVLLAQLLGTLQAPLTNLCGVLQAAMRDLVGVLDAVKDQKSE